MILDELEEPPDEENVVFWLVGQDTGELVGIHQTWEKAKEGLEEVNDWPDGQEYRIVEHVKGEEPELTFTEVE